MSEASLGLEKKFHLLQSEKEGHKHLDHENNNHLLHSGNGMSLALLGLETTSISFTRGHQSQKHPWAGKQHPPLPLGQGNVRNIPRPEKQHPSPSLGERNVRNTPWPAKQHPSPSLGERNVRNTPRPEKPHPSPSFGKSNIRNIPSSGNNHLLHSGKTVSETPRPRKQPLPSVGCQNT